MRRIVIVSVLSAAIACAIIAAAIVYVRDDDGTRAPTDVVLERLISAVSQEWGSPNTTFHQVERAHDVHPVPKDTFSPAADTKTERWLAWGSDGNIAAWYVVTTDASGKVYQTSLFMSSSQMLVTTDLATGKTDSHRLPYFATAEEAARFRSDGINSAMATARAGVAPGSPVGMARDAAGATTYVITFGNVRDYIDMSSYTTVQTDELATDGSVTRTSQYPVTEVLSGNAVPVVTPIAGPATTPLYPPTATATP